MTFTISTITYLHFPLLTNKQRQKVSLYSDWCNTTCTFMPIFLSNVGLLQGHLFGTSNRPKFIWWNSYSKTVAVWKLQRISIHRVREKRVYSILGITSSNNCRFSEFFHFRNLLEICNKAIVKYPTSPQTRHYTTLWNIDVRYSVSGALWQSCWKLNSPILTCCRQQLHFWMKPVHYNLFY